jgi:Endonuclease/Exonuclease/phosphatase family
VAKALAVASWNCEHWHDGDPRNKDRIEFLAAQKADVLTIYEVEGAEVWRDVMSGLPGYSFFITEGQNTQEVLVGIAPGVTAFLTQKVEFQSRDAYMRPGAFLTARAAGVDYSFLFLHVASMPDARGFGLRTDMIDRALAFNDYLDKVAKGKANFVFLGDLNAMGLDYVYGRDPDATKKLLHDKVPPEQEVERLGFEAAKHGMRLLPKDADYTWGSVGGMRSNLDHVVAADHLRFKNFGAGKEVTVRGWPELDDKSEQTKWIERFSDHGLLYFELQK